MKIFISQSNIQKNPQESLRILKSFKKLQTGGPEFNSCQSQIFFFLS